MKLKILSMTLGLIGLAAATGVFFGGDAQASNAHLSRHGNGEPKESTFFLEGRRHGSTQRWYQDGTLRAQGEYDNGKMVGEWLWQEPDGSRNETRSGFYEHGVRVSG
ncbi:MAG: antitoxin component YwqK of YwqJK toxin-antitoxin module [Candidatus Paceibacteria bacterium]|jgi:antitoxin component YwqK of YwqJK toxin-antitoxin module